MTKTEAKQEARSCLIHGMVNAIFGEEESGAADAAVIEEMRAEAAKLALKWGWVNWPGLPGTFAK